MALGNCIGVTRGGRNTKLHAICDTKGRPCVLLLTSGYIHDYNVAQACIEAKPPSAELVADKGMIARPCAYSSPGAAFSAVMPPRRNRKIQYD